MPECATGIESAFRVSIPPFPPLPFPNRREASLKGAILVKYWSNTREACKCASQRRRPAGRGSRPARGRCVCVCVCVLACVCVCVCAAGPRRGRRPAAAPPNPAYLTSMVKWYLTSMVKYAVWTVRSNSQFYWKVPNSIGGRGGVRDRTVEFPILSGRPPTASGRRVTARPALTQSRAPSPSRRASVSLASGLSMGMLSRFSSLLASSADKREYFGAIYMYIYNTIITIIYIRIYIYI